MKEICRQTLETAYLILDGEEISDEDRGRVEEHLEACQPCFERYGIETEVKSLIGRLKGSEQCPDAVKQRIEVLLKEA